MFNLLSQLYGNKYEMENLCKRLNSQQMYDRSRNGKEVWLERKLTLINACAVQLSYQLSNHAILTFF